MSKFSFQKAAANDSEEEEEPDPEEVEIPEGRQRYVFRDFISGEVVKVDADARDSAWGELRNAYDMQDEASGDHGRWICFGFVGEQAYLDAEGVSAEEAELREVSCEYAQREANLP